MRALNLWRGITFGLAITGSANAQIWTEVGDAGQNGIDEAQITWGIGALTSIEGTISSQFDIDIYCIRIVDEANFLAQVNSGIDMSMYLFDAKGNGVVWNDDRLGFQPGIDSTEVTENGVYFLAVSVLQGISGPGLTETHARDENDEPIFVFDGLQFGGGQSLVTACSGVERPNCDVFSGRLSFWETSGSFASGTGPYTIAVMGAEFCSVRCPTTLHVPSSFATIQDAIDFSVDGDVIVVAPGMYVPASTIDVFDRQITIRSEAGAARTTLSLVGSRVIQVRGQSGTRCRIEGFTITGNGVQLGGGARISGRSAPVWVRCRFIGNVAPGDAGGGVDVNGRSAVTFERCEFRNNRASFIGAGAVVQTESHARFVNSLFADNSDGGAVGVFASSSAQFLGCTIVDTMPTQPASAIWSSNGIISGANNIIFGNPGMDFDGVNPNAVFTNSLFFGGMGTNIDADPLFLDGVNGDYHLSGDSPAIDAGDCSAVPASALNQDLDGADRAQNALHVVDTGPVCPVLGGPVDMGCYEAPVGITPTCLGDANGDGAVDFGDITTVLGNWLAVCP